MRKLKILPLLHEMVLIIMTGFAQSTNNAAIGGYVKDARNKTPLIEAVVTISSDAFEGSKFALTDSTGLYSVKNLPPGTYTVSFEMEGYRKFTQENIILKEGMSLGVSFQMAREHKKKPKKLKDKSDIKGELNEHD